MASIMAGYPLNVGALMLANMTLVAQQENTSFPYPNTIMEYLTDAMVESRPLETKIKPTCPFDPYKLQDPRTPSQIRANSLPLLLVVLMIL